MTQAEWQAERMRLSIALDQADKDWAGFRARGDWDNARKGQGQFYQLRNDLAAHDRREPDKLGNDGNDRELTLAEWQAESERIANELQIVSSEWKILRDKGQWEIAGDVQSRYHLLRKQQAAHARIMPAQ